MRFLLLFLISSCFQQQSITVVEQDRFKAYIAAGHSLIDVRTPEEFAQGHIEGAQNLNFLATDFSEKAQKFNKKEPLLLYCRSGNRSAKAAKILDSLGFQQLFDLKGGFLAWEK
ncbi:MAG: rhodanese-like domain-containing protein [Flavobacteriaceae bacterium]|jgi:rhodanese-related sulfurtransferase